MCKPLKRTCLFVRDKDYSAYDTYAIVENFKHKVENGEVLSDEELLAYKMPTETALENVSKLSFKAKRRLSLDYSNIFQSFDKDMKNADV